jgi:hypothetical protein
LQRAVAYGSVLFARRTISTVQTPRARSLRDLFYRQCIFDNSDPREQNLRRPILCCVGICYFTLEMATQRRIPIIFRVRLAPSADGPSFGIVTVALVHNGETFVRSNLEQYDPTDTVIVAETVLEQMRTDLAPPSDAEIDTLIDNINLEEAFTLDSIVHAPFAGRNRDVALAPGNAISDEWIVTRARNPQRFVRVDHVYVETLANARRFNPRLQEVATPPVNLRALLTFPALALFLTQTPKGASQ